MVSKGSHHQSIKSLCNRQDGGYNSTIDDSRRSSRLRTYKGVSIIIGVAAAIDCTTRNMSPTGAALDVVSRVGIPDEFTLLVKPEFVKRDYRVV